MRLSLSYFFAFLWFFFGQSTDAWAKNDSFFELGLNYGYQHQVFGARREAKFTGRTYAGSVAWYLFTYSALEINYSYSRQDIEDNTRNQIDPTIDIINSHQRVVTEVYGAGIRQALAPRDFFIVPTISMGYAKQFQQSSERYIVQNNTTGNIREVIFATPKRRIDSVFATLAINFNVTQTFRISGSATTIFKYFQTARAKDNVRYLAGISWIF